MQAHDAIELAATDEVIQAGEAPKQSLTVQQRTRLRWVFKFGRPVSCGTLTGVDLDLIAAGYLQLCDGERLSGSAVVKMTDAGMAYLHADRQRKVASLAVHNTLGSRLADCLRGKGKMTWENISFANWAPYSAEGRVWSEVRPDVYACEPVLSAAKARPEIYEVKVSRADFLADLAKPGKRAGYADLAEAVYYCAPDGLLHPSEVPGDFGLICEMQGGGFQIIKRARRRKSFVLHPNAIMTMVVKRGSLPGQSDSMGA